MIVSFSSGGKGGTGKSTLSLITAVALAVAGKDVLLIDTSSEGGVTRLLLENPEPPFFRDILRRKATWYETILSLSLRITKYQVEFDFIPNLGNLPESSYIRWISYTIEFYDYVILDLPAFQDVRTYHPLLKLSNLNILVSDPSVASVHAVISAPRLSRTVGVLNKFDGNARAKLELEQVFDPLFIIPYDPALPALSPTTIHLVFAYLSKSFQKEFLKFIYFILNPYGGDENG